MQSDEILALSALVTGIALTGALAGWRSQETPAARLSLTAVFVLMAGLCAIPLIVTFFPALYLFYMPALLPVLLSLPVAVHRFAKARLRESQSPESWRRDAILPAAGLVVMLGYWMLPATAKATLFVEGDLPAGVLPAGLALLTFGLILCWVPISFAYLAATLRALGRHRDQLKSFYSNTEAYELRWIDGFLALLVALWIAAAITLVADNLAPGIMTSDALVFLLAAAVLLMLIAFAVAPTPPQDAEADGLPEKEQSVDKYARSALSAERSEQIARRIAGAMQRNQLYLDPNLSLQKLARHVGAPINLVSQTLNEQLGVAFFDYVAHWRIEAAKPSVRAGDLSILTIALDVGFNSRSTFYKAFKRETGLTPKAYQSAISAAQDQGHI